MSLSRRSALGGLAACGATAVCGYAAGQWEATWAERRDDARRLLGRSFSLDMHMHPALFPVKDIPRSSNPRTYRGDDAFAARIDGMREGGLWTGFFTPVVDAPVLGMTPDGPGMTRPFEPGEAWQEFLRQVAVLDELLEANDVVKATSVDEVRAAHAAGKIAAMYGCEGGDHIENDPGRAADLRRLGVRSLQIYHVAPNSLVRFSADGDEGLSDIGRETIVEMNHVGLLADLAHASYATTSEAAELSTQPILSTHNVVQRPGGGSGGIGLSAEHVAAIVATGGVIGTFGGVPGGVPGFVDHVLRLVDVAGIDHVGIGTDMDGTGNLPAAIDNYALLPEVCARLFTAGYSDADIAKIVGGNVARVLDAVMKEQSHVA